jgi:uncharacterized SAM-binding protein YcdF (DUF218 family)
MVNGPNSTDAIAAAGNGGTVPGGHKSPRRLVLLFRTVTFSLAGAAFLFAGGFGLFVSHIGGMETPADLPSADAIIVLTGGQARLDAGIELLKSGKGERLLISGVHPAANRDDLRAATGGDRNLFSCCVDIDHAALDTIGNAAESAKWVRSHHYGSVILVTNNYHMPRSLLEMGRYIGDAELQPYPVVNTRLDNGGWVTNPDALRVLFTEYNKYLVALARGVVPVGTSSEDIATANASSAGYPPH